MEYKLLEIISKKRTQLTVNDDTTFLVNCFYENEDINIIYTKKDFEEKVLRDFIEQFSKDLDSIISKFKKIDYVEIAGEFIRTPILQKIIEDKKIKIYKGILIDECTSVGAALLGNFFDGNFPITQLNFFEHYNYYEKNNQNNKEINIKINEKEFMNKIIEHIKLQETIDNEYILFVNEKTNISKFYYNIKKLINKYKQFENQFDIKKLERELRKNNINYDNLKEIKNQLNIIHLKIFNELYINKKNNISEKLNQYKNEENSELKHFILNIEEKIQKLDNENIEINQKYERLTNIGNEINNSKFKEIKIENIFENNK